MCWKQIYRLIGGWLQKKHNDLVKYDRIILEGETDSYVTGLVGPAEDWIKLLREEALKLGLETYR